MDLKDCFPTVHVRNSNSDLSVEPPRPKQSCIQNIYSIGSSNDNHTSVSFKSIHLCK
eukprot:Gb_01796 [translate_table: standard]